MSKFRCPSRCLWRKYSTAQPTRSKKTADTQIRVAKTQPTNKILTSSLVLRIVRSKTSPKVTRRQGLEWRAPASLGRIKFFTDDSS